MKNTTKLFVFLVVSISFSACYYNNEEDLLGTSGCSTSNMSYKTDIVPILDLNCNGCHSSIANLGNVALDNHTEVKKYAQSMALVGVIEHSSGFSPMPKNGAKISDCDISKIKAWINQGILNN